jgi:hypothetical protein
MKSSVVCVIKKEMRKFIYRLVVALLTFMLGIVSAAYLKRPAGILCRVEVSKPSTYESPTIKPEISVACSDELLEQISNDLMSDNNFVDFLAYDNLKTFDCSENFRIEKVDLNRDGRPEFVVRGLDKYLCTVTGNCSFWVYHQTKKGYEKLLEASDVQQYSFRGAASNGYRDLITFIHDSAFESSLSVYKFDGEQYQLAECGGRSYSYIDKDGHFRIRKHPLITLAKCFGD